MVESCREVNLAEETAPGPGAPGSVKGLKLMGSSCKPHSSGSGNVRPKRLLACQIPTIPCVAKPNGSRGAISGLKPTLSVFAGRVYSAAGCATGP